jgi:ATP-dependent 26S proteasome regulatory subunit
MPNTAQTRTILGRYLVARVPFVAVRTVERARVLPMLKRIAEERQLDIVAHTLSRGVYHVRTDKQFPGDKSLWSALEYAGDQFQKRSGLTIVFTDVQRIGDDCEETRHLLDLIAAAAERDCCVMVLTSDPVWPALQMFGMAVTLDPLDFDELVELAHNVLEPYRGRRDVRFDWDDRDYQEAASILAGVTRTQAVNLLSVLVADRSVTRADLPKLSEAKEAIFSDLAGIERVTVRDSDKDVGGLRGLTAWLDQRRPLLTMDLRDRGMGPPRGVLLIGVPGCGKSLSAKAVSARWGLPLYRLDMASIMGMYVGQSESRLREALATADRVAPCVLWIDEIEKGLAGTGTESTGITTRLVGQFLYWLQESTSGAFVVATANSVATLPPELLRHGRFDAMFFVDLPDAEERREIALLYVKRYLKVTPDDDLLAELEQLSDGFSGAEIDAALKELARTALLRKATEVPREHYSAAFAGVVPFSRSHAKDLEKLREMRDHALPASGRRSNPPPRPSGPPNLSRPPEAQTTPDVPLPDEAERWICPECDYSEVAGLDGLRGDGRCPTHRRVLARASDMAHD